jgi:hypothetical protein
MLTNLLQNVNLFRPLRFVSIASGQRILETRINMQDPASRRIQNKLIDVIMISLVFCADMNRFCAQKADSRHKRPPSPHLTYPNVAFKLI